ncbi:hypothetical protein L9F63_027916, partial [Diploptera punctata]
MPSPSTSTQISEDTMGGSCNPLEMYFDDDNVQKSSSATQTLLDDYCEVIEEVEPSNTPAQSSTPGSSRRKRKLPDHVEEILIMARELHEKKMSCVKELHDKNMES